VEKMPIYKKYPRTFHLPSSEGISNDDKVIKTLDNFIEKEIIISEKLDGENFTLYNNNCHARSIDSKNHISRTWVKNLQNSIGFLIPENYRICGENLWAKHSIFYDNLESYFYGFSLWENDYCIDWYNTVEFFKGLNIVPVPVLYQGKFSTKTITEITKQIKNSNKEGFVVRLAEGFSIDSFNSSVVKWVRKNHVSANDEHWLNKTIVQNKLKIK